IPDRVRRYAARFSAMVVRSVVNPYSAHNLGTTSTRFSQSWPQNVNLIGQVDAKAGVIGHASLREHGVVHHHDRRPPTTVQDCLVEVSDPGTGLKVEIPGPQLGDYRLQHAERRHILVA